MLQEVILSSQEEIDNTATEDLAAELTSLLESLRLYLDCMCLEAAGELYACFSQ